MAGRDNDVVRRTGGAEECGASRNVRRERDAACGEENRLLGKEVVAAVQKSIKWGYNHTSSVDGHATLSNTQ